MNVNGIIAEYNPFHNGHKYQLEESVRLTNADFTVVVMSGNFVQRGAPALVGKRLRTEMALRCGADLVLELPVLYATASSEYFAAGAVALLHKLGVVTHLCFGSECGATAKLQQIAAFLAEEPKAYQTALKQLLKQGLSYPDARAKALRSSFPDNGTNYDELLSSPNNILGIDYIKEIIRRQSDMIPVTVKRIGSGYHDTFPAENLTGISASCNMPLQPAPVSALAIRQALYEGQLPAQLHPFMPEEVWPLLDVYLAENNPLYLDAFSNLLYYKLLLEKEEGYEKYLDVSAWLSNRIRNSLNSFSGFGSFCDILKTKAITHTRISRCLIHILLGITKEDMANGRAQEDTPYARMLGFSRSALPLLRAVKAHSRIPLITRLADAQKSLPQEAGRLLKQDILASEIYKGLAFGGTGRPAPNEFSTPLVIV